MEINVPESGKTQARILKIHAKCSDSFVGTLLNQDGQTLKKYEGYVPPFFPGEHYGDYIILDIDIDTGVITNWKKIKPEEIEKFITGEKDDWSMF